MKEMKFEMKFDQILKDRALSYAYAIMGGLSFQWRCVDTMLKSKEEDAEWVQAQLLFFIDDYLESKETKE